MPKKKEKVMLTQSAEVQKADKVRAGQELVSAAPAGPSRGIEVSKKLFYSLLSDGELASRASQVAKVVQGITINSLDARIVKITAQTPEQAEQFFRDLDSLI